MDRSAIVTAGAFVRVERKYLMDAGTARHVQAELERRMDGDAHNNHGQGHTVTSLYYDTERSDLVRASLRRRVQGEAPSARPRVPALEYGTYLEIKRKIQGRIAERRLCLPLREAYALLDRGALPALRSPRERQ